MVFAVRLKTRGECSFTKPLTLAIDEIDGAGNIAIYWLLALIMFGVRGWSFGGHGVFG